MNIDQFKENIIYNPILIRHKSKFIIAAKIIIAAGLLTYLVIQVNFAEIINAIKEADILFILGALLLLIVNIYLQYWKWEVVCRNVLSITDKKKILTSLFYGFSAGSFTPGRIGEYFGRAISFRDKLVSDVTVATFVDKTISLLIITFIGALAAILFLHFYYHVTFFITASLFIFVFTISYIFLFLLLNPSIWKSSIKSKLASTKRLAFLIEKLSVLKNVDKNTSYKVAGISALFFICMLLQYVLLASAFSHHFNFVNYLWIGILVFFAKSIIPPVSIGDLGIREGASVFFISFMGENGSIGFNASIFLFLINVLIPAVIGMLLLFQRNDD
jgi:uncharacterized membrane protein YbhN (UPF0104 family)